MNIPKITVLGWMAVAAHPAVAHDCSCQILGNGIVPAVSKSSYNLFNPTPDDLLRDLDTDRPDKSTSPRTVDAGHLQIESDILRFSDATGPGIRTETWSWGATDFRIGLTNWADLQ